MIQDSPVGAKIQVVPLVFSAGLVILRRLCHQSVSVEEKSSGRKRDQFTNL